MLTTLAPTALYASSEKSEREPAPLSTLTLKPSFISLWVASGDKATLLSLANDSLGTPIVTSDVFFPNAEKYLS